MISASVDEAPLLLEFGAKICLNIEKTKINCLYGCYTGKFCYFCSQNNYINHYNI